MILESVEFAHPAWLMLLPILFILTLLLKKASTSSPADTQLVAGHNAKLHVFHPLTTIVQKRKQKHSTFRVIDATVMWLVVTLLLLAMAQPERIGERLPDPLPQRDITFIVDTSVSMTLRDYIVDGERVSRMTVVKGVLDEFVKNLQGSQISVVVFGEHAYTYIPSTSDHNFVRNMFARMQTTMAGRFNAIGDGIALAVRNADTNRHTVLVLLTDADRETGRITPANAARLAKQAGLPLYTVAIGAATASAEEKRTAGLIYQPVNLELLEEMSNTTGAKSYRAGATLELKDAIADIERREQREVTQEPRFYREALYHWLLLPAMLLLGMLAALQVLARCRQ